MKTVCLDGYTSIMENLSFDNFGELGEFVYYDRTAPEEVKERCKDADIILTNKVVIGKKEIDSLPNLKYISVLATGYNIVDTEYAREKNIAVSNVPKYSADSVAQHTFAVILDIFSRVSLHSKSVLDGEWVRSKDFCFTKSPLTDLAGKSIGIIGYGAIGRKVAKIAQAFDMKVFALSRGRNYETDPNVFFGDYNDIFGCDIISVHCPATEETVGMINGDFLKKMKNTAVLINMARGTIAEEKAVADALNKGIIAYYGTDVICREPMDKDCPLLKAKNIIITPHIAWAYEDSRKRLLEITYNNVKSFIDGNPINLVN